MPSDRWTGSEHCGHCFQSYAYELEVFCAACDGPMCPLCVVQERFDAVRVCSDCARDSAHAQDA